MVAISVDSVPDEYTIWESFTLSAGESDVSNSNHLPTVEVPRTVVPSRVAVLRLDHRNRPSPGMTAKREAVSGEAYCSISATVA
jgi:hypothetical protein